MEKHTRAKAQCAIVRKGSCCPCLGKDGSRNLGHLPTSLPAALVCQVSWDEAPGWDLASGEKPCWRRELLVGLWVTGQGVRHPGRHHCRHPSHAPEGMLLF